jgi:biopolymer transport protein ExbD
VSNDLMLTLSTLRHSFYAAVASPLLVLFFCFMPVGTVCRGELPWMPRFAAATPQPEREADLVISVRHDGYFYVGPVAVRHDELCDELQYLITRNPDREIVLQIDRRSRFAGTRSILQTVQHLGIRHLVLRSGNSE